MRGAPRGHRSGERSSQLVSRRSVDNGGWECRWQLSPGHDRGGVRTDVRMGGVGLKVVDLAAGEGDAALTMRSGADHATHASPESGRPRRAQYTSLAWRAATVEHDAGDCKPTWSRSSPPSGSDARQPRCSTQQGLLEPLAPQGGARCRRARGGQLGRGARQGADGGLRARKDHLQRGCQDPHGERARRRLWRARHDGRLPLRSPSHR